MDGMAAAEITDVERDIAEMVEYWARRKVGWRQTAGEEFGSLVCPEALFAPEPTLRQIQLANLCFTEWVIFERPLRDHVTPLELYVFEPPAALPAAARSRLRQVAGSQFFSRFAILDKDRDSGIASLRDVRTGRSYDVLDRRLCGNPRWRTGTMAERIACVDGVWQIVGQARLYDRSSASAARDDGPGEVHAEDAGRLPDTAGMSYFLRLVRDVIGIDGRYASTVRVRA